MKALESFAAVVFQWITVRGGTNKQATGLPVGPLATGGMDFGCRCRSLAKRTFAATLLQTLYSVSCDVVSSSTSQDDDGGMIDRTVKMS